MIQNNGGDQSASCRCMMGISCVCVSNVRRRRREPDETAGVILCREDLLRAAGNTEAGGSFGFKKESFYNVSPVKQRNSSWSTKERNYLRSKSSIWLKMKEICAQVLTDIITTWDLDIKSDFPHQFYIYCPLVVMKMSKHS